MTYQNPAIAEAATVLRERLASLQDKQSILRAPELAVLYQTIRTLESGQRRAFGKELNSLKSELQALIDAQSVVTDNRIPIDVTSPIDSNAEFAKLLPANQGSTHPITSEINRIIAIFERMGFSAEESREIDDQYNMFESLNFPKGHPARDEYDTFMTVETDTNGDQFIAPAHTSTMQNRTLRRYKASLEQGDPIAVIVPDRVFRNEDLDARHEHTFYQLEGVYVSKGVHAGMLIATLQKFLEEYYGKQLQVQVNPYYFPFTEPSFEFALSCPFCEQNDPACKVCSGEGWIELLGCGMIHPNVLNAAGIDHSVYTGFAFGCGIDRLVMMKYGIEDVRHFESAKLDFLRQFS
ncbi:MAG TPA: phenylalanine--tRNA ligase subunit alpha [Candidatus Saccharibacteria bacterium]|nr:phenylalanine--tRNA ligase subunit alpha [Candidatus Saccharibacteria bacterium]